MILLPLILAAAPVSNDEVQAVTGRYGACVISKAQQWASGPDSAQVVVTTAEGSCEDELKDVRSTAYRFVQQRPDASNIKTSDLQRIGESLADATVQKYRKASYAAVLQARSKKTP